MFVLAILLLGVGIQAAPLVRHHHCRNSFENSHPLIAISCVLLLTFDPISQPGHLVSVQVFVSAQGRVHNHLRKYILREFQNQLLYSPISLSQENVERNVTDVVCRTEYIEECHREYIMGECHTEYEQECHEVPTVKQVKLTELKCTTDQYGEETCKNIERLVPVPDTEEICETKAQATQVCYEPETICEVKPHDICYNVVTKKTEKVPRKHCKTVQKKVCY